MKFGVVLPQFGRFASPQSIREMARAAEALGWDSVWLTDHIVVPTPYTSRFTSTYYELFTTLGFLAACTERVRLGTTVAILPYRHPVVTAKLITTVDNLSHGRLIFGAAFGWMREEYEALDIPYAGRGRRSDECLRALKACLTAEQPAFEGEFYSFSGFAFAPAPVQRPFPPVWIGGNDERTLERVVAFGDGWHPISGPRIRMNLDQLAARIRRLRELADAQGRDADEITLSLHTTLAFDVAPEMEGDMFTLVGSTGEIVEGIKRCEELGISHLILSCYYGMPSLMNTTSVAPFVGAMERFTSEVIPRL